MPTRSTRSIPPFRPSATLFHSPCGLHQFKTFSRFPRISLCIVEFMGKNCTSSNTTFLTSAVALGHLLLTELVTILFLPQHEQQIFLPIAL
jgi:hypothetical protein